MLTSDSRAQRRSCPTPRWWRHRTRAPTRRCARLRRRSTCSSSSKHPRPSSYLSVRPSPSFGSLADRVAAITLDQFYNASIPNACVQTSFEIWNATSNQNLTLVTPRRSMPINSLASGPFRGLLRIREQPVHVHARRCAAACFLLQLLVPRVRRFQIHRCTHWHPSVIYYWAIWAFALIALLSLRTVIGMTAFTDDCRLRAAHVSQGQVDRAGATLLNPLIAIPMCSTGDCG